MHAPSFIQLVVSGLLATSAANGFQVTGPRDLARPLAGALVAYAVPALAAPSIEQREPHHKGRGKAAGNKRSIEERHHKGRGKNAGAKRDIEEEEHLEARHHKYVTSFTTAYLFLERAAYPIEVAQERTTSETLPTSLKPVLPTGRGKNAGAKRAVEEEEHLEARHHKGRGKAAGN
ncbi:hypothetical protein AB5N19_06630 [Seiridium cardinale]